MGSVRPNSDVADTHLVRHLTTKRVTAPNAALAVF